jgi:hypothetical protein
MITYSKEQVEKWIALARQTKFSLSKIGYSLTAIAEILYNIMVRASESEDK